MQLNSNDCVNLLGLLGRVNITGQEAKTLSDLQQKIAAIGKQQAEIEANPPGPVPVPDQAGGLL